MRKTIHKWIWAWDFDREEKWLNEMAAKGLCLVSVGFCRYDFEDCLPGKYKICIQFLDHRPSNYESAKYIEFMEDTGAEHVGTFMRWVYFRKRTDAGDLALFSDNASRVRYLTKVINFIIAVLALNLFVGVENMLLVFFVKSYINLLGLINIAIAVWGSFGVYRLCKKRKKMKTEERLFE